jgi:thiosulfate/3-mercaptopyruvate sulfurtransferase
MAVVTVDTNWLASHLDDPNIVIIDARGIMHYRFGHIKNALPLSVEHVILIADNGANLVIDAQTAEKVFSKLGIDRSKSIVVVYGEYLDPSAARIVWTLMYHGHPNVKLLDVGYSQWHKAGLPITKQIIPTQKSTPPTTTTADVNNYFASKINLTIRADANMIKEKQNDPNAIIVDARTPQEHLQARILGSILHNWEEGIGYNGKMIKDKDELKRDFEEKGITKDKEVICYCHSGTRASHKYLQLKQAGFDNVRVYDGSIIDWAQRRNPLR